MKSKGKQGEAYYESLLGQSPRSTHPLPPSEAHRPPGPGLEQGEEAPGGVLDSPWETLKRPASN